jgi:ABC-type bacteriocin/lantibiotic exporter with double-glycine peptidase domain
MLSSATAGTTARPIIGCGEQCIKLLCTFYKKQISEDKIKEFLKPNQYGEATFKDIERCIKKIGLNCYAFKGSSKDLDQIRHPVILHFKNKRKDKVGHFLVALLDPKDNKVIGFDPASSGTPFELTFKKLDNYWTGAGLVVFPKQYHYRKFLLFVIIASSFLFGTSIALIEPRILQRRKEL